MPTLLSRLVISAFVSISPCPMGAQVTLEERDDHVEEFLVQFKGGEADDEHVSEKVDGTAAHVPEGILE